MKYRTLGNTDLELSVITFGAWAAGGWMWGGADRKQAVEAILASYDEGVTSIDTAPIYGQGTSEEIVGEAIKNLSRDKVQILTKFGMRWDLESPKGDFAMHSKDNSGKDIDIYKYAGKASVIKECEDSLKRLGTDYIDLLQIHWPESTTPIEETFEAVAQLIQEGKVRFAGVCNYDVEQMKRAESVVKLASNQVPYSMVNRGIEDELIPYCIEHQKGILAYSPMQRGLLTGKIKLGQKFGQGDTREGSKFYSDDFITRTNQFLEELKPLAAEKNATLGQLVLRWTVEQPGITIALAGARNAEQSVQNAGTMKFDLSIDELKFISDRIPAL